MTVNYSEIIKQNTTTMGEFRTYNDSLLIFKPILLEKSLGFESIGFRRYPKRIGFFEDCIQASLREMEEIKPTINSHPQNLFQYLSSKKKLLENALDFHLLDDGVSYIPVCKSENKINKMELKLSLF